MTILVSYWHAIGEFDLFFLCDAFHQPSLFESNGNRIFINQEAAA